MIKQMQVAASDPKDYSGPDFAVLKPWDEFQTEVWTYKENKRLGLYNNHMAERVKQQFDKDSLQQAVKEERRLARKTQKQANKG